MYTWLVPHLYKINGMWNKWMKWMNEWMNECWYIIFTQYDSYNNILKFWHTLCRNTVYNDDDDDDNVSFWSTYCNFTFMWFLTASCPSVEFSEPSHIGYHWYWRVWAFYLLLILLKSCEYSDCSLMYFWEVTVLYSFVIEAIFCT